MNPNSLTELTTTYLVPFLGLVIGIMVFIFVGYINWYGKTKIKAINWLSQNIFRDKTGNKVMSDSLFMTLTSYLVAISGIIIITSILFLSPLWGNA